MKKTALFALVLFILSVSSLSAELAYWFVGESESYKLKTGAIFSDQDMIGKSNAYPIGSVVDISSEDTGLHAIVTIADSLDEHSLSGMDIALSAGAMTELGIFGIGHGNVSISLIKEGTENAATDTEGSGWFMLDCGIFDDADSCYQVYSRMIRNGLKPKVDLTDEGLHLTVPHIREYQIGDTDRKIALSGIDKAEIIGEANPYLR